MKKHSIVPIAMALAGVAAFAGIHSSASAQTLINQWNFNETSGTTAANSVGGGASATLTGNATFNGSGGVTLNGTGGTFVNLGSGLLNGPTSLTFEAWFSDTGVNNTHLFSFDNGDGTGSGGTYLRYNVGDTGNGHNGNDFLESIVGWGGHTIEGTSLANNTLLHVAVVYDPSASYEALYVNGSLISSYSGSLSPVSNYAASIGSLGRSPWAGYGDPYLNGTIDQFSIYSGALSGPQILADYQAGPVSVPEPSALALGMAGLTLIGVLRRKHAR